MSDTSDTRDRVIAMEVQVLALVKAVEGNTKTIQELHNLLQQAKGAKWVFLGLASVSGFVSAKFGALIPFATGVLPK